MSYLNPVTPEGRRYAISKFHNPNVLTFSVREAALFLDVAYATALNEIRRTNRLIGVDVIRPGKSGHPRVLATPFRAALGYVPKESD